MTPNLVYIIMPVGSDEAFESKRAVLEASSKAHDWITHFPLDSTSRQDNRHITETNFKLPEVLAEMKAASLIVADLSLERPSCYYELGVAQALGRPTFLLAVTGTVIHQVADRDRIHFYADLKELSVMMDIALTDRSA
jgi:nucleoside 2-deoxyribosyltransferase